MIKLITILSEIKNLGGKNLQELISYVKKYNDIINKLKDIQDTYKNYGQGYASRFNIVGDSSSSPSRINQFRIPSKKNIENIKFAYKYAGFESFTKWASNSGIVQNLTGDTKQDIEDLKNRIKTFIKDYYLDRKKGYEKQVDRSILDLKKLYQDDLGGEEILGEYDVQGGLNFNVDDDESWMYDDLGGPYNEIKNLSKIDIDKVLDLVVNKVGLVKSSILLQKYIKKEGLDPIYNNFPMSTTRKLSLENLRQFYLELTKVWEKDKPVDEVYTDDLGGEEIYGS